MFVQLFQNIKRSIKTKTYRLTIFEIALFGLLLAIYIISALIQKYAFRGIFRISLTYAVVIIFGLALGPLKGAIMGLLGNTIESIINGIGEWMLEYAMIPVIIALLTGFLMNLMNKNQKQTWIIGFIFLFLITTVFIVVLITHYNNLPISEGALKRTKTIPLQIVIGISAFGIFFIWAIALTLMVIYFQTRNIKRKYSVFLFFNILIVVFFILVLVRWLWGPFAYITYRNRFRGGNFAYNEWYSFFMIPIVFKGLIEIPFYTLVIFHIYPVLRLIREKIIYSTKKISTY